MNIKLGRHYLADLYLCQKNLGENPSHFVAEMAKALSVKNLNWVVRTSIQTMILISGEFETAYILVQMFPKDRFLTLDFFSWDPDFDPARYGESLIELFAPQVIATETKFRAEHLN